MRTKKVLLTAVAGVGTERMEPEALDAMCIHPPVCVLGRVHGACKGRRGPRVRCAAACTTV